MVQFGDKQELYEDKVVNRALRVWTLDFGDAKPASQRGMPSRRARHAKTRQALENGQGTFKSFSVHLSCSSRCSCATSTCVRNILKDFSC